MNAKDGPIYAAALTRRSLANTPCGSTRRSFVVAAALLSIIGAPAALFAQAPAKVSRIGVHPRTRLPAGGRDQYTNFFDGMRKLGYVEGRNMSVQWMHAENDLERLPGLAVELVKQKVDLIVTNGSPAVRAAQKATSTIPILALTFANVVELGFAASLARPGGNITGLTTLGDETAVKRVASAVPAATRIAYLLNPDNPGNVSQLRDIEKRARAIGREIVVIKARAESEFGSAFEQMVRARAGALVVANDTVLQAHERAIGALAMKHKLPLMIPWPRDTESALMTYTANYTDFGLQAATMADKLLKGAKPADLPIQQPTNFPLVVNLKTAKALGITVPQSLLLQATRVIE